MASSSPEEKLSFVMMVLKHTDMKPDWGAVAEEAGITLAGNATRKFRQIVKTTGYDLVSNKIVSPDGGDQDAVGTTPAAATTTPTSTKRKSPTKKAAKGEGSKTKKAKVNAPAGDEETIKSEVKAEEKEEA